MESVEPDSSLGPSGIVKSARDLMGCGCSLFAGIVKATVAKLWVYLIRKLTELLVTFTFTTLSNQVETNLQAEPRVQVPPRASKLQML